jgi:hypothetical protein
MNKVYIVCETIDGEKTIGGVYASYKKAREHAEDIAEYAGVEEDQQDFWGEDEDNCITIEEQDLL